MDGDEKGSLNHTESLKWDSALFRGKRSRTGRKHGEGGLLEVRKSKEVRGQSVHNQTSWLFMTHMSRK